MTAMRNPRDGISRINQFPLKNGTSNFVTTIGYVNNTSTSYCYSFKYQLGKAG